MKKTLRIGQVAVVMMVFWGLLTIIALQFISRFILNDSISWTEEIARYVMILLCFTGAVLCSESNEHIKIDIIHSKIPKKYRKFYEASIHAINLIVFLYLTYWMFVYSIEGNQRLSSIDISKSLFFFISGFGLILMSFWEIDHILKKLFNQN